MLEVVDSMRCKIELKQKRKRKFPYVELVTLNLTSEYLGIDSHI